MRHNATVVRKAPRDPKTGRFISREALKKIRERARLAKERALAAKRHTKKSKPAKKLVKRRLTAVKSPAKKPAAKKPQAAARKRRAAQVSVTLNGVKLTLKARATIAALIAYTAVPPARAIVRVNERKVSGQATVTLHAGDVVKVRRITRTKKPRVSRKERPKKPRKRTPKKKTERVKEVKRRRRKPKRDVWVNAFDEEWLKSDGSVAVEMSYARLYPEAAKWHDEASRIIAIWGKDSPELRRFADAISDYIERPVNEVYTLFFSP